MSNADSDRTRAYYDALGEGEWDRLEATIRGRVSFAVHRHFLERFVVAGDHVLEIGAGPGRFTLELAEMGARVEVTDLSPVQLDLHRRHVGGTPAESAVLSRSLLDVRDTSRFAGGTFDVVVAYGGPLSYAFDDARSAFDGLLRVTKPGGFVVASVMSLLGTWRYFLGGVLAEARAIGEDANDLILTTGDLRHGAAPHLCRMFRSSEISSLVDTDLAELVAVSASNWASLADELTLEEIVDDPERWRRFMVHELAACSEPGAVDGGTHLLFAAQRRPTSASATT